MAEKKNRFTFTEAKIRTLAAPTAGRAWFYDDKQRGLAMQVTPTGSKSFYLYVWHDGKPCRELLGKYPQTTVSQARDGARQKIGLQVAGVDLAGERRARQKEATIAELWENYLELHAKVQKKSWKEDQRVFGKYLVDFHDKRLSAVTKSMVAQWHARLGRENGPTQANRAKSLLQGMYYRSSEGLGYTGPNPCKGVASFPERSRERFLLPTEMQAFFAALAEQKPYWQGYFLLCLLTGTRRGNIGAMEWAELDLENALWHVPGSKTKNKRPMTIALSPPALAILRTRLEQRNGSQYVFPAYRGSGHLERPQSVWVKITAAAKLENLRPHDLRRSLGSWQAGMGISLPIIGKSLGHTNLRSTQVYARLQLDPVRDAVSRAGNAILDAAHFAVGPDGMVALNQEAEGNG